MQRAPLSISLQPAHPWVSVSTRAPERRWQRPATAPQQQQRELLQLVPGHQGHDTVRTKQLWQPAGGTTFFHL